MPTTSVIGTTRGSEQLRPNSCECKSTRVWTRTVLRDDGLGQNFVPAGVGGTIIFEDIDGISVVRWDTDKITLAKEDNFIDQIYRIGQCATFSQYYLEKQNQNQFGKA